MSIYTYNAILFSSVALPTGGAVEARAFSGTRVRTGVSRTLEREADGVYSVRPPVRSALRPTSVSVTKMVTWGLAWMGPEKYILELDSTKR